MKIEVNRKFVKDTIKLPIEIQLLIKELLLEIESNKELLNYDIKKLKGHKSAFRIKLGSYRIGYYLEDNTIS